MTGRGGAQQSPMSEKRIYTIGHGNKSLDEFVSMLESYRIETLADIRSYPRSKRNPHFNAHALEASLSEKDITYKWVKALGGFRKEGLGTASPHHGLKSEGFRNYADYMMTSPFKENINEVVRLARHGRTCLMCAETIPFRCHRNLVSDHLSARGIEVIHIISLEKTEKHRLSLYARIDGGNVIYDRVEDHAKG